MKRDGVSYAPSVEPGIPNIGISIESFRFEELIDGSGWSLTRVLVTCQSMSLVDKRTLYTELGLLSSSIVFHPDNGP
jgi:hypothetical protein